LGTGSGVLAIAAAKLGFDPILACDHERAALEAARANAVANGVELDLRRANLRREAAPAAPTVVANLTAGILREIASRLERAPRLLICSGLLIGEAPDVVEAFAARGLRERERRTDGDWVAISLSAPPI
jgi:ribosomal protein L11 methyltransferase